MRLLDSIRFRLLALFRRSELNAEMEEELRSHIQLRADDLERSGISRSEAERRAAIEFGSYERIGEDCHEAAGKRFGEVLFRDVTFAIRILRKSPAFTLVAVGTLALAIGANAVVFAALNAIVLRPLNVPQPESLYSIHRVADNSAGQSYLNFQDFRDRNHSFEDIAGYTIMLAGLDTGQKPSRTWFVAVTGNYFDVLHLQPQIGRFFHASDEHGPNSAPYIVLSHAYWNSHFQADPSVIGRVVQVNKHPFTIIGVAPQGFHGTLLFAAPDLFLPMVNAEQVDGSNFLNARGTRSMFMIMGHLKPGVTPAQAAADINSVSVYLEKTYPKDYRHLTMTLARPSLYGDYMGKPMRAFLSALMLLAGLILLAACANLGSLFAARAADRSREVALRLALGGSRLRILRQLFTEAVLISLVGGALGLWGGVVLLRWLSAWQPFPQFPINLQLTPDFKVYLVALLLALASGFLFGAVPVRQVLRTNPYEVVKSGMRTTRGRRITGRDLLVVVQIAICAVLVTSSIVAVRGLVRSLHSDFGFDPRNVLLVNTALEMAEYRGAAIPVMQKRMVDAVKSIPGVSAVSLVDVPPLSNGDPHASLVFREDTADLRPANAAANAVTTRISPDYFTAAGTPLVSGRQFTEHDDADAPQVAIITPQFARKLFGTETDVLGRRFKNSKGTLVEVIGTVPDGKYVSLTENPAAAMFVPILQSPASDTSMLVRSEVDPQQLTAAIKGKLQDLDSGLPAYIHSWNQAMDLPLFPTRIAAVSLGILGLMGAMLSVTGIFGIAAYSISNRLRELGIRIALGAMHKEILRAALGRPLKLLAYGSVAGLTLGLLATRVLSSIVYQASPRDPLVFAGAVLAMLLLGLLATWVPARRALSVDPLILLREE
jgi:predicted permease